MKYDLIVIGMGPAGISAALYAKRSGLKVLLLEKSAPGGLLNIIDKIENYPGHISISGPDLAYNFFSQVKENNIEYKIEEVTSISFKDNIKTIQTTKSTYEADNVIIASGRKSRKLGLENEDKLLGKGISTCAMCDGMFYKDKDIAIVGSGSSAFQEALYLSKIVKSITILSRSENYRAEESLIDEVKNNQKITILDNAIVTKLQENNNQLESIIINDKDLLTVQGLFIYIGYEPNNSFVPSEVKREKSGYIKVDENYQTNIKGLYAIGGAIATDINQIITVSAQGARCAMNIVKNC